MIDFRIIGLNGENITYEAGNLGSIATGDDLLLNAWLKNFYNENCGGFVRIVGSSEISSNDKNKILPIIALAVSAANTETKKKYKDAFSPVKVKTLDISRETGSINLTLEIKINNRKINIKV